MKFNFNSEIRGISKTSENGIVKKFEGATLNFEVDANVEEIIQLLKDKQLGVDKLLAFVKSDLPQTIKDCGSALLSVEKQNRQLNAEMPSQSRKEIMSENNALRERIEKLVETVDEKSYQLDSAQRDRRGTSEALKELQEKYNTLNNRYEFLKKKYLEENPKTESWDNL